MPGQSSTGPNPLRNCICSKNKEKIPNIFIKKKEKKKKAQYSVTANTFPKTGKSSPAGNHKCLAARNMFQVPSIPGAAGISHYVPSGRGGGGRWYPHLVQSLSGRIGAPPPALERVGFPHWDLDGVPPLLVDTQTRVKTLPSLVLRTRAVRSLDTAFNYENKYLEYVHAIDP